MAAVTKGLAAATAVGFLCHFHEGVYGVWAADQLQNNCVLCAGRVVARLVAMRLLVVSAPRGVHGQAVVLVVPAVGALERLRLRGEPILVLLPPGKGIHTVLEYPYQPRAVGPPSAMVRVYP